MLEFSGVCKRFPKGTIARADVDFGPAPDAFRSVAGFWTLDPAFSRGTEPCAAFDEIPGQRLGVEWSRLFVARRFAAVLVTHSVTEAVFLGNRVLVMSERPGRIIGDFRVPFDHP